MARVVLVGAAGFEASRNVVLAGQTAVDRLGIVTYVEHHLCASSRDFDVTEVGQHGRSL
jgi:hypothetical protein